MNVIFDVFGVLMSSGFSSSAPDLARLLGRPTEDIERVYVRWEEPFDLGHIDAETFWKRVLSDLDVSGSWQRLNQLVLSNYRPNRRALALLQRCAQFQPTHILSNTRREWFDVLDEAHGITQHADRTFLSCDLGLKKPDPRIYEHVVSELHGPAEHILFIDDREKNIESARAVGLNGIVFTSAEQTAREMRALGIQLSRRTHHRPTKRRRESRTQIT